MRERTSLGVALIVAAAIVAVPWASSISAPGPPPGAAGDFPPGAIKQFPGRLPDGSSYSIRSILDESSTVGVATQPNVSALRVVVVSGEKVTDLHSVGLRLGPLFDGFIRYDGQLYWTETTQADDGVDRTELWAADLSLDPPAARLVATLGAARTYHSRYDIIVADGTVSWTALGGIEDPQTVVRSMPLPGGPVTESVVNGIWRQIDRPWLVTVGSPTMLLNQSTGDRITVPGSDLAPTTCLPDWCRVTVAIGEAAVRLELVAPDGSGRSRIAGPDTYFATVDPAILGRYEILAQPGDLPWDQQRLLLYDSVKDTTGQLEIALSTQTDSRDGWVWWKTADWTTNPVWHALNLNILNPS